MAGDQRDNVLTVEDDLLLSMVAERLVNNLGYHVVGKAVSGKEAIQKAADLAPDVIIMDISLKGTMNGIEAMREIRKTSQVSVIYLSGSADDDYKELASQTNYVGYLTKPVTIGDLEAPLTDALHPDEEDPQKPSAVPDSDE